MAKRRFVQDPKTLELVEVGDDYIGDRGTNPDSILWNDRSYQDMGDRRFASRTAHREYMKRHGLTTADDYTQTWERDKKVRQDRAAGIDPSRRKDLVRAIERLYK